MKKTAQSPFCRGARLNQGFALLLVLVAVTLASLLALGMLALSNKSRLSSRGLSNSAQTELLAQAAMEHAVAILDHNIPQPLPPGVDPIPIYAVNDASYPNYPSPDHAGTVPPTNWVINPGLLTLIGPGNTSTSVKYVSLSSNPTDPYTPVTTGANLDPNLNAQLVTSAGGTAIYPIRSDGTPLNISWVNVLQDPTQPAGPNNKIVGRYGFWIDDESAKVNINMAYGKGSNINLGSSSTFANNNPLYSGTSYYDASEEFNTASDVPASDLNHNHYQFNLSGSNSFISGQNASFAITVPTKDSNGNSVPTYYPLWHPAAINMDFLLQSAGDGNYSADRNTLASWVHNVSIVNGSTIFNWRPFQNSEQIKSFLSNPGSAATEAVFENLKFNITTKARSPEFNVFGKSRLYLESRAPLWDADMFFQLNYDGDGPEYFQSTETAADGWTPNQTGIYSVVNSIVDKLTRTDWPGMPASSFYDKWLAEAQTYRNPATGIRSSNPQADTLREIDQVAWNIAAWGTYAADREPAHNVGYSLSSGNNSSSQAIMGGTLWPSTPDLGRYLMNFCPPGPNLDPSYGSRDSPTIDFYNTPRGHNSISQKAFNAWCQKGPLSGKAILPWFPRPLINEVAVVIQLFDGNGYPIQTPAELANSMALPPTGSGGYYAAIGLEYEIYEPPGMPPCQISTGGGSSDNINFIPTHFEYTIQDAAPFSNGAGQTFDLYTSISDINAKSEGNNGMGILYSSPNITDESNATLLPGRYYDVAPPSVSSGGATPTQIPELSWVASGTYLAPTLAPGSNGRRAPTDPTVGETVPLFNGPYLKITNLKVKVAVCSQHPGGGNAPDFVSQIIPIWDTNEANNSNGPFTPPSSPVQQYDLLVLAQPTVPRGQKYPSESAIYLNVANLAASGGAAKLSMEVDDARNGGSWNAWTRNSDLAAANGPNASAISDEVHGNSIGRINAPAVAAGAVNDGTTGDDSKYRFFDYGHAYYNSVDGRPSTGMLSVVPLGMQRDIPYDTFKFNKNSRNVAGTPYLPDWLLLDLVAPTIRPYSYMNSAMGKVNLNAQIYNGGETTWPNTAGSVNPVRWQPLQAVFQNMEPTSTVSSSATAPSTVVGNIISHTASGSGLSVAEQGDGTHPGVYDYIGEICDINGVADTGNSSTVPPMDAPAEWAAEGLIRNVTNLVTTQSNTFTVWGIAQSIQKSPSNNNPANQGIFEAGDQIQSTKRFTSTIERYVWPGKDGVPGNGAVKSDGTYANVATGSNNTAVPSWTPHFYPNPSPYGASNGYFPGPPSLPQVGLLPWLPLPLPPMASQTGGGGNGGALAAGTTWPLLDGPDAPTFPNLTGITPTAHSQYPSAWQSQALAGSRYDCGWHSFDNSTMVYNSTSSYSPGTLDVGNGSLATDTTGNHNIWGPDDPTSFWTPTALEESNNPTRAWMKYRTVDFRYLDQ